MTEDEQAKFDVLVFGLTSYQKEALAAFISDVSDAAYQRGIDAESYANTMSHSMREDD